MSAVVIFADLIVRVALLSAIALFILGAVALLTTRGDR